MIVEYRTYRTQPGMRSRFLDIFRERTIGEHARLGMPIAGPFECIDDPDVFFFSRSFADEASRAERKAAFYDGPLWKDELEPVLMPMLRHYEVAAIRGAPFPAAGLTS